MISYKKFMWQHFGNLGLYRYFKAINYLTSVDFEVTKNVTSYTYHDRILCSFDPINVYFINDNIL